MDEKFDQHRAQHEHEVAEESKNPYSSSSEFFEAAQANLDATKNMGYMAREMGKYGSHPSHDDFEDESDS